MKVGFTGGSFGRLSKIEFIGVGDILLKIKKNGWCNNFTMSGQVEKYKISGTLVKYCQCTNVIVH